MRILEERDFCWGLSINLITIELGLIPLKIINCIFSVCKQGLGQVSGENDTGDVDTDEKKGEPRKRAPELEQKVVKSKDTEPKAQTIPDWMRNETIETTIEEVPEDVNEGSECDHNHDMIKEIQ